MMANATGDPVQQDGRGAAESLTQHPSIELAQLGKKHWGPVPTNGSNII
jgi:hypothetical protein